VLGFDVPLAVTRFDDEPSAARMATDGLWSLGHAIGLE
jgi:hypothetical protein